MDYLLCSNCFVDEGLRLDAVRIGVSDYSVCPHCGSGAGSKLNEESVRTLAYRFFVWGTLQRLQYGGAPSVQFNESQKTSITIAPQLKADVRLIEQAISIGFFYYGPALWMIGEVEPLKDLQDAEARTSVISRILKEYPPRLLNTSDSFYRIRKDPKKPEDPNEYDSPPSAFAGTGRLDSVDFPVMYGSQDLQVCVHECRVTAEDDLYVGTLQPTRALRLIDLTELLQEYVTAFESLDLSVNMLFLAGKQSYDIAREIAKSVHAAGYDGIVYPSYFSLLRTGGMPFETAFGLSRRHLPTLMDAEKAKVIGNVALFGRPIEEGKVLARCVNKLILSRVEYAFHFGPASV